MSEPHFTREPENVADLKARDQIVRRFRKMRAEAVLELNTIAHWNRMHPDEQLDCTAKMTDLYERIIAWCDGEGPIPPEVASRLPGGGPKP